MSGIGFQAMQAFSASRLALVGVQFGYRVVCKVSEGTKQPIRTVIAPTMRNATNCLLSRVQRLPSLTQRAVLRTKASRADVVRHNLCQVALQV